MYAHSGGKRSATAAREEIKICNGIGEGLTEGSVNKHRVVQLSRRLGDRERLHLRENAEGVALGDKLLDVTLVQGTNDEQHNIVDHVAVPAVQGARLGAHSCGTREGALHRVGRGREGSKQNISVTHNDTICV